MTLGTSEIINLLYIVAQQEDKHPFRNEENRAHSKSKPRPRAYPMNGFEEEVSPGDTICGFKFAQSGVIKDLSISVDYINTELMPVNIEIRKNDESVLEIERLLSEGDSEFHSHRVNKGERLVVKARDMKEQQFRARGVYVSFNLITQKDGE